MKKYSNGSFTDAAVRIYGSEADTLTSFPAPIIANGGNITPWSIYGNTVDGASVGEHTTNMFNKNATDSANGYIVDGYLTSNGDTNSSINYRVSEYITILPNQQYITYGGGLSAPSVCFYDENKEYISGVNYGGRTNVQFTTTATSKFLRVSFRIQDNDTMFLNVGTTALPYEPYGYKLPVVIGSNTTNIYMADVLRKSTGAEPVYDIMSSTGIITRNVDTDGTPLVTPTTESFTAPTLATVAGSQSVSFDTTVKPSKAELTYTGWHTHTDKKYSGGSWGTVTSNAKKKKSLLGSRKTTKGKT